MILYVLIAFVVYLVLSTVLFPNLGRTQQITETDYSTFVTALKKKIAARMQSVIGLQPDIKIVEPRSIERSMGKAKHVIDKRKLV